MADIGYDGQVAIITGSGGGLGREHAHRDVALPGVGLGGQPDDLAGVLVVERLGQPVGHLEDAAVGAAADCQRERPALAGAGWSPPRTCGRRS